MSFERAAAAGATVTEVDRTRLPSRHGADKKTAMRRALTTLRILLGLCLAALAMTAPAAAWDAHALLHASAPVAVDDHHHHDEDGEVLIHDEGAVPGDPSEDEGKGHDHMPSLGASLSVTVPGAPAPFVPPLVSELRMAATPGLRLGIPDPPPARPPRFA